MSQQPSINIKKNTPRAFNNLSGTVTLNSPTPQKLYFRIQIAIEYHDELKAGRAIFDPNEANNPETIDHHMTLSIPQYIKDHAPFFDYGEGTSNRCRDFEIY